MRATVGLVLCCSFAACRPAERNLDVRGVWAPTRSEQGGQLEFTSAGAWELIQEGDSQCGYGVLDSWVCEGPGTWRLGDDPSRYNEEFDLYIHSNEGGDITLTAWFRARHRLCWDPPFGDSKCYYRLEYP